MSQYIDSIRAEFFNGRKASQSPIKTGIKSNRLEYDCMHEYKISVNWERTGYCKPSDLSHLVENAIRELKRDVYGDLELKLITLERAVYEQDRETALSTIRDIMMEIR